MADSTGKTSLLNGGSTMMMMVICDDHYNDVNDVHAKYYSG
jgi:hypothetical protein